MEGSTEQIRVFVSYSWSSPKHEQWVLELAERLTRDGIYVRLDKWDLKEGQDKHSFMEEMVNNKEIKKVLVICDKEYQIKADKRKGGVGTETQLISKEVYENTGQEKFIPIVREYDGNKPCIPNYMASRIYIDLSSDDIFEENYQKLLRNLYNRPMLKRPALGTTPAFIDEGDSIPLRTSHKVAAIKRALIDGNTSAEGLIVDYLDTFIEALEDYRITDGNSSQEGYDDKIVSSIEQMQPLINDFTDLTLVIFKYKSNVDLEIFQSFFENLLDFLARPNGTGTSYTNDKDNFRFFNYQLTLNFIAVLIKLKRYKALVYFVNTQYFFKKGNLVETTWDGIEALNEYVRSLDEFRNNRIYEGGRKSVTADLIKEHSTRRDITFEQIIEADLVLYYCRELSKDRFGWFPKTPVYRSHYWQLDFFKRLVSKKYFEKIKLLFKVDTVDELREKVKEYTSKNRDHIEHMSWHYDIGSISQVLNIDNIGTID